MKMLLKSLKISSFYRKYSVYRNLNISSILETRQVGENVEIKGWIKSVRKQKQNVFIDLSDGSTDKTFQIFVPQNLVPKNISTGSSIISTGTLKLSPNKTLELAAENINICGECVIADGYPFAPRKQYSEEYIRQFPQFRSRTSKFSSLLRVRSAATLAIHQFFNSKDYINISTPILTSNDCEGAGEVFRVVPESPLIIESMRKEGLRSEEVYFGRKVFLSVSGQLHLEAAAHGLSRVYSFSPTFRAENSRSRLHLSEFYMLEAETAFLDDLGLLCDFIEDLVKSVTREVLNKSESDLQRCSGDNLDFIAEWIDRKFRVVTYDEAAAVCENKQKKFTEKFDKKNGFAKEHELYLVKYFGGVPVFVINWPKSMKPFYMRECGSNVAALDLLAPGVGEIAGGSLRENNYEKLKSQLPDENSQLDWYLDLRKFGGVPTGGFGLGFERYLQFILGISNIKDTIPFPRWPHNCNL